MTNTATVLGLVSVLATGTCSRVPSHFDIVFVKLNLNVRIVTHDSDRNGAGVSSAFTFCRGYSLDAVSASLFVPMGEVSAFELQDGNSWGIMLGRDQSANARGELMVGLGKVMDE
jgi:hypothetical protein